MTMRVYRQWILVVILGVWASGCEGGQAPQKDTSKTIGPHPPAVGNAETDDAPPNPAVLTVLANLKEGDRLTEAEREAEIERLTEALKNARTRKARFDAARELKRLVHPPALPKSEPAWRYLVAKNNYSKKKIERMLAGTWAANATFEKFVEAVEPLDGPLDGFIPFTAWSEPIPVAGGEAVDLETYYRECYRRGFIPTIWIVDAGDVEVHLEKFKTLERLGYPIFVFGRGWGQFTTDRAEVHATHKYCIGTWRQIRDEERARCEAVIAAFKKHNIEPDFFYYDWEKGFRARNERDIANIEKDFVKAKDCPLCRKRLDPKYLEDAQSYVRAAEVYRSRVAREAWVEPLTAYHPDMKLGNYYSTPHTRSDKPLPRSIARAVGWHGAGWHYAMPVLYSRMYKYMDRRELVAWNMFRFHLEEISVGARNLVGDEYLIPWTKNFLLRYANKFVPRGGAYVQLNNGRTHYPMPESAYTEMLRHGYLRGARTYASWITYGHAFEVDGENNYLRELKNHRDALNDMLPHRDVIYNGRILNTEVPGDYDSLDGAAIWSGMATNNRAVIRATSFTGKDEKVEVEVFGRKETLTAPAGGKTHVVKRRE